MSATQQSSRRWGAHVGARLIALALAAGLVGCGSPAADAQLEPTIPAATRLAQVFGTNPTATASAGAANSSAEPTIAATTTSVAQPAPSGPDPRVRLDCTPLSPTAAASNPGDVDVDVRIDLQPTGRTISPLIYGVAAADAEYLEEIGATVNRWGGNQVTRHNWEINASNSGADWYFANVSHGWPDEAPGASADRFISSTQTVSATAILTIPTIGYVARDGDNTTRSQDVPEQGGAPLQPDSERIAGYDPRANQAATSIASFAAKGRPFADPPDLADDAVYQDEWINHLVRTFGRADQGGQRFYALDNEPDLWSSTHRDIHPADMGYDAMLAMFMQYADAIKAVDPTAQIVGPELWGANSLFYSALDRGDDNFGTHADRLAHGDAPFLPWFLAQVRLHDQQVGRRSLDVLSVHNYPQSGVFPTGNDPKSNALRLRSTQQLWNPNYTDESWLSRTEGGRLQLIPRLRAWVDAYYPGTQIGVTEWNYGADDTINGGLTIADVLGIYGREGLDLATYWTSPQPGSPGASAFKLYGNYDGCGRHFGDQLLSAQSSDEQSLSAYASRDGYTGAILVMTVNKLPNTSIQANIGIDGLGQRSVQVYQFNGEQTAIQRLADAQTTDQGLAYSIAPYAATLFVIRP
jgi:hypothetical protein